MVKVNARNEWKPVDLDGLILSGSTEGLIGIEECTDYDLCYLNDKIKKTKNTAKIITDEGINVKSKAIKKKTKKKKIKVSKTITESIVCQAKEDGDFSPSKSGKISDDEWTQEAEVVEKKMEIENMRAWDLAPLPETIIKALELQKFYSPTEIQMLTLPAAIIGKRDILGAAETGSGKTLAFGLPILCGILKLKEKAENDNDESADIVNAMPNEELSDEEMDQCDDDVVSEEESDFEETDGLNDEGIGCVRVINNVELDSKKMPKKPLYSLILTPTRELAVQIRNHLIAAAKFTGINVAVVVGGMAAVKQERILSKGPEIVVATPGRLWELIQQGNPHLSQVADIRFLAIDETDRMIEKGHFKELHHILEKLNVNEEKKKLRQNFVFSATLTLVHEMPRHLKMKKKITGKRVTDMTPAQKLKQVVDRLGITNPKVVDITKGKGTSGTLTESRIICSMDEKDYYVYYFLQRHPGRTLIFCNSIGCVKSLATLLSLLGCNPLPLHASMQQRQRLKNLDRFKEKENSILVATDVAARGLDIPSVEHVLHYQTPRTSESYVHRSGRTARASKEGITVLLVETSELQNYLQLCRTLGKTEDIPIFPVQDSCLQAIKRRVNLAREVDKLDLQIRKANSEVGWFQKAADDMDIIIDDDSLKYDVNEAKSFKKQVEFKRKQLQTLLQTPVFPQHFQGKYPSNCNADDLSMAQGEIKKESAIDVMKKEIEVNAKKRNRRTKSKKLFASRIKKGDASVDLKTLMKGADNKKGFKNANKNKKKTKRN